MLFAILKKQKTSNKLQSKKLFIGNSDNATPGEQHTGKEQSDFAESYAIGFPKAQMHYPRFNTLRTVETKSLKLYRTVNISRTPSIKCQAGGV